MEATTVSQTEVSPDAPQIDKLVEGYIKLRDRKDALRKEFEKKVEDINSVMTKIENALLKHLNAIGGDSIKTPVGTVFKKTVRNVGVADWDRVLEFIRENEMWDMLEHRVSKTAVEQYKEEHNDLPPGVNWSETTVVQIRRS
jgi:hypothetical protein